MLYLQGTPSGALSFCLRPTGRFFTKLLIQNKYRPALCRVEAVHLYYSKVVEVGIVFAKRVA